MVSSKKSWFLNKLTIFFSVFSEKEDVFLHFKENKNNLFIRY